MNRLHLPAALTLLALGFTGCGGGGSSSGAPAITADPEGIYTGVIVSRSAGTIDAYMAATASGNFRYAASNGATANAQLSTGSGTVYFPGLGSSSLSFSNVTVTPGSSITGSYTEAAGDSGTFSFTYSSLYTRPQTLAALAGTYVAYSYDTTTGVQFSCSLTSSGAISGTDSNGGAYTGTLAPIDASKNLYNVTLNYTGGTTYTGLAFWADTQAGVFQGNTLYVQVWGTPGGMGAVFTKVS